MVLKEELKRKALASSCVWLIISILALCFVLKAYPAHANPLPANLWETYSPQPNEWGYFSNATGVEMVSANVRYDITASNTSGEFSVKFSAQYKLFNPNDSQTMTIAFPFHRYTHPSQEDFPKNTDFQVEIGGKSVAFAEKEISSISDRSLRYYLAFNASLASKNITILNIWFQGDFIAGNLPAEVVFRHNVFTSNAWSGNKTIAVQFIAWDNPPVSYWSNNSALVSHGVYESHRWSNYSWYFSGPEIDIEFHQVGIAYSNPDYIGLNLSTSVSEAAFYTLSLLMIIFPWAIWRFKRRQITYRRP